MIHASIPTNYQAYRRTDLDRLQEAARLLFEVQRNRKIDADVNRALNHIASATAKLG